MLITQVGKVRLRRHDKAAFRQSREATFSSCSRRPWRESNPRRSTGDALALSTGLRGTGSACTAVPYCRLWSTLRYRYASLCVAQASSSHSYGMPHFHRERGQAIGCPGLTATLQFGSAHGQHTTIFPGNAEFTAGAWAARMDSTANPDADLTFQGDAMGLFLVGAFHAPTEVRHVLGQFKRDTAALGLICLTPVEGDPVPGAASAAAQTRILVQHGSQPPHAEPRRWPGTWQGLVP